MPETKENDKKTLLVLLAIFGLVLIVSAFWLYDSFKPEETSLDLEVQQNVELARVMRLKAIALDNISDFLKLESLGPESIWENFYNDEQYRQLEELEVVINISEDIGNPNPFVSTATTSDEELIRQGGFFGF
ncbi:MAG: hypothetical protein PHO91_02575 [Patescibacteria group bacterium]|nr:hypothetical protein [Patescibacteria group bacterium]